MKTAPKTSTTLNLCQCRTLYLHWNEVPYEVYSLILQNALINIKILLRSLKNSKWVFLLHELKLRTSRHLRKINTWHPLILIIAVILSQKQR